MADIINVAIETGLDQIDISISDDLTVVNTALFETNETVNVSIDQGVIVVGDVVSINNIGDVTITNPENGQTLKYDSSLSKWVNKTTEYKHNQNNAAETWEIQHNLNLENYLPNVSIVLSGGSTYNNIQGLGIVQYVNKDQLNINFLGAKSGYALIKN